MGRRRWTVAAAVVLTFSAVTCAWSQAMQQAPTQQKSVIIQVAPAPENQPSLPPAALAPAPMTQQPAPEAATPHENPGLFNEIGKLFKDTPSLVPSWSMPSLGSNSLAGTVIKGRVACPVAANGAPDCKAASDKLCQAKGFKEGKSLDTDAAQSCSAKVMIPGRPREEGDCRTDNYVTQALCK